MQKLSLVDKLFLVICIIILIGGFLKPIIIPSKINVVENRTAYRMPTFSLDSFVNKNYQDLLEKSLSDQIPFANKMKLVVNTGTVSTKKIFYGMLDKDRYYDLSNGIYQYNGSLVYSRISHDLKLSIDKRIDNINKYVKKMPSISFNAYYIERDVDIDFTDNSKIGVYEYLAQNLDNNVYLKKFEINNFNEFKDYFYKTDHHWNHIGSYKAYREIASMITDEIDILYQKETCFSNAMSGSKAIAIGGTKIFRETFCGYSFDLPAHDIYINYQSVDNYGKYATILANGSNNISYGDFYGNDFGIIHFDYHRPEKDNLLIIGESYDNAINELLASHFNHTYNIDLRYYETTIGKEFNLFQFVEENNIHQILLIGNVNFFTDSIFELKGDK